MAQRAVTGADFKKIDLFLEDYYESGKTRELGAEISHENMQKSQVRGLENLIVSTTRFSEIINYVKNQAGKAKADSAWARVGPKMLSQLETLEKHAAQISGKDARKRMEVKLHLVRGWMRQVVAHYLYSRPD